MEREREHPEKPHRVYDGIAATRGLSAVVRMKKYILGPEI